MKQISTILKIFALFIFNSLIFQIENPIWLTCILVFFILLGFLTKYPVTQRLKTILPIAILIIFFQIVFNSSVPFYSRIFLGYMAAVRLVAISLSVLLFLTFTSFSELIKILSFLPQNALLVIMMTCYFIPGVLTEGEKIKAVQKSRGMNINNIRIITNLASLIVPLIHRVLQRAETLSMAIISRGYEE